MEKVTSRLKEIELVKDIFLPDMYKFIKAKSQNTIQIMDDYGVTSPNELIPMLYSELKLSELFIKSLNDYCFLLNLRHNNENCKFEMNYNNNHSNFFLIKSLIESQIKKVEHEKEKMYEKNIQLQINLCEVLEIVKERDMNNSSYFFDESNRLEIDEFCDKCDDLEKVKKTPAGRKNSITRRPTIKSKTSNKTIGLDFGKRKNSSNSCDEVDVVGETNDTLNETLIKQKEEINHLRYVVDEFNKTITNIKTNEEKKEIPAT